MYRLWATWRKNYIKSGFLKSENCIFCIGKDKTNDRESLILKRGVNNFIIMNLYPYNPGHLMVVPYRHLSDITKLNEKEFLEMKEMLDISVKVLKDNMNPEGFNIGFNIGKAAGAGIDDHLHLHIVPRWSGDTNFIPVLSETKVMSIDLFELYDEIVDYFNKM